jgi:hypothetical protein
MQPRSAERQRALSWELGPHAPRRIMNLNEVPSPARPKHAGPKGAPAQG